MMATRLIKIRITGTYADIEAAVENLIHADVYEIINISRKYNNYRDANCRVYIAAALIQNGEIQT